MSNNGKSRQSLDGAVITIRKGLAIYKIHASPYYFVRMRDSKNKKNIVRSTKEMSRIEARKVAEEIFQSLSNSGALTKTPKEYTFDVFAEELIKQAKYDVAQGTRSKSHIKDTRYILEQKEWGLLKEFSNRDIREIQTKDFVSYIRNLQDKRGNLSHSTHTQIKSTFRRVMRMALLRGVISSIPETPKLIETKKQVPRTFFRFHPIVPKEQDEYEKLKRVAEELEKEKVVIRGHQITSELRNIIMFLANSFLRPTYSELYALRHSDIIFRESYNEEKKRNEQWLLLTIHKGKTGKRLTDTMPAAAGVYNKILKENPHQKPDDYVFLPSVKNRNYASQIIIRQFNYLLNRADLKIDKDSGKRHSLYSIRHLSLGMRVFHSKGKADLLILAQNAGTSLEMLQSFYLNNLPRTKDVVKNLQSFGE